MESGLIEVVERSPAHALRDAVATGLVSTDLDHVRYAQRGRTPALGESVLLEVVAPLVEAHDVGLTGLFEREGRRPEAAGERREIRRVVAALAEELPRVV